MADKGHLEVTALEEAKLVPVSLIKPNPYQPRSEIKAEDVQDLTSSIKADGILEPLLVCPEGDQFQLIAGYRRLTAAKHAKLTSVPCVVRTMSEPDKLLFALTENNIRQNLTPLEEAEAIKQLMDLGDMKQKEVAKAMHRSEGHISERLNLLGLRDDIKALIVAGEIAPRKAIEVNKIKSDTRREKLAAKSKNIDEDDFKTMIQTILTKKRKKYEKQEKKELMGIRGIAQDLGALKIYKDRLTLKFDNDESLIQLMKEIIERYEKEMSERTYQ